MTRARIPLVDLKAQYRTIQGEIDEAIARVISRTSFILGEEVDTFEREFAAFCGVTQCIGVGNGTDALTLALQAVGVRAGDEVITVPFTFIATAEAIGALGATPVFVDVRSDTLLMDPAKVESAITPRTRAIVPVHLYGQMVDMDPLIELAKARGIAIIEDAAQAHGASHRGRIAGSVGRISAFSFYPGKNLGAYGDAGAVVTSDPDLAAWVRKARDHGRMSKYEHEFEGRNSRMDGIQGAVLAVKLRHLARWNEQRRALAVAYDRELADVAGVVPVVRDARSSACHIYAIRIAHRDRVLAALRESGIEAGAHYPVPLHLQRAYARLGFTTGAFPIAEAAGREVLSLPLYPELPAAAVGTVVAALQSALGIGQ